MFLSVTARYRSFIVSDVFSSIFRNKHSYLYIQEMSQIKTERNYVLYLSDSNSPCWSIWTTCLLRRLLRTSEVGFHNVSCCPDCFSYMKTSLSWTEQRSVQPHDAKPPKELSLHGPGYLARLSVRTLWSAGDSFTSFSPAQKQLKLSPSVHQESPRAPPP